MSALIGPAAEVATPAPVFDVEDETFLGPGDMVSRIERWFVERGQQPPVSRSALPRPILQSLADAYARAIDTAR